ncbi:DUF898 family protein [Salinibacterium sp. ZJ77]|nr:DUF898 family protein [Salinibacterium sp. ZJ77]
MFTGSATGLFGHWIKWLLLSIITLGIYDFAQPTAPVVPLGSLTAASA